MTPELTEERIAEAMARAEQLGRTLRGELSQAAARGTVDARTEGECFAE
jgi:hypothetical protein